LVSSRAGTVRLELDVDEAMKALRLSPIGERA
jgi:hypothetical protein